MPIEPLKPFTPMRHVLPFLVAAVLAGCGGGSPDQAQPLAAPARIDRELAECRPMMAGGRPPAVVDDPALRGLCFEAFAVIHDASTRTPKVVLQAVDRASLVAAQAIPRVDSFYEEARLPAAERSTLADYRGSGYDRGHMAPNGDMPDRASQAESFSLANMVPQVHANNAGIWAGVESAVRHLAIREGEVYVVTGPAFIGDEIASLKGRVLVPTHLWKIVYSPKRRQAGAYLVTNDETRTYSALSISELERMIGIAPLPGVPQRVRDAAMDLPVPSSDGASAYAGKKRRRGGATPENEEFSLSDFARQTIESVLKKLMK